MRSKEKEHEEGYQKGWMELQSVQTNKTHMVIVELKDYENIFVNALYYLLLIELLLLIFIPNS